MTRQLWNKAIFDYLNNNRRLMNAAALTQSKIREITSR